MKQFLMTVAGVFVGLVLFVVGVPFLLIVMAVGAARPAPVPAHTILNLDLRGGLSDQPSQSPFAAFGGGGLSVMSVSETLRRAETDDKVKGVLVRLPDGGMNPAAADELRLAFKHFRAVGKKPIYAHSQGLYPSGMVTSTYMLGAAASQFWMQPDSSMQAVGAASETLFYKRLFEKYGVKAQYEQRYEYKNAVNPYLQSDYTPAHRESTLSWMGSIYRSALATAAADRGKNLAALTQTIEAGPYSAQDAKAKGLIDKVGQVKEAQDALLAQAGKNGKLMDFDDYISRANRVGPPKTGAAIAVINAEGAIVTGTSASGGAFGAESTIYSDDASKAIYDAIQDKDVKAIVLRVSSPGGSDTASEQILAAVKAAKAAGKPVVVSMGAYAASGGYWISSYASSIYAQPTTLTGSIGVFGGKFALGDALSRFGVDTRQLSVGGDYAGAFGTADGFTPDQRAKFASWMDRIYDGFVARVAEGRQLPPNRVREIAKGRVWTGLQAKQLGLVDEIGGFYDAVDKAKSLAGLKGEVRLKAFGGTRSPFEALEKALGVSSTSVRTLAAAGWILGDPRSQAILDEVAKSRMRSQGAAVLADTPIH
ncbi:signal peptide peptidase SppA [Caulobacter sp. B11]|uniref:signal peptide peptidase SppA n=1 Tax=Caulobacter sp. B11 TaxID=2048899 RepID=UPI000C12DF14|nr:signal peptide peptidase SppA [Caulobacter sp. B11]PHY14077.1 signal peptide peptidase SppA [Caulobacter sp. B11]